MRHRVINDGRFGITLTLGVGDDQSLARISWVEGSCHVQAADLSLGRWTPAEFGYPEPSPPATVVCRATALAVRACVKEGVLAALEGLS